jgi:phosphoglycerate dehydrogenase-like enzyme
MRVVNLSPLWGEELTRRLPPDVELQTIDRSDAQRLSAALPPAVVLVTAFFDREMASRCASLELIVCPAAGTDGIDRGALPPGVPVKSGIGHEIAVAEHVIGALVALRRRFAAADSALRHGSWIQGFFGNRAMVDELYGSALGIIGFGRIGAESARRARAFGMRVRAVTMHPDARASSQLLSAPLEALGDAGAVDDLVATSDAIVVACELSPLTHGLIDARRLALMRRSAVLVNVARGPIVVESALFAALEARAIAGAALDVWYRYPEGPAEVTLPSAYPFERLDNVLMTPHASGWTEGAKERKLAFMAACITEHARSRAV